MSGIRNIFTELFDWCDRYVFPEESVRCLTGDPFDGVRPNPSREIAFPEITRAVDICSQCYQLVLILINISNSLQFKVNLLSRLRLDCK